ncbi:hypothetical protein GDO78_022070 [Eleutherodactylus coqui]|uniref:Uncharacterized protein n=1 Tax=Eleutherodactylus coqui TaxID=57060 RepID=A0A8J6JYL5_ELECQ|nr:hypothetical protein GDO78_022070 [Eleutherodactylus coqui]
MTRPRWKSLQSLETDPRKIMSSDFILQSGAREESPSREAPIGDVKQMQTILENHKILQFHPYCGECFQTVRSKLHIFPSAY